MIKFIKYEENYEHLWQEFVFKYGNLYHDIRWKKIIERSYKLKPNYFLIYE